MIRHDFMDDVHVQVTRDVFEASAGRLKVVGRAGVGVDNVDLGAATEVRQNPQQNVDSLQICVSDTLPGLS